MCRVEKKALGRHVYSTASHFSCMVLFLSCNIGLKAQHKRNVDTCESTWIQLGWIAVHFCEAHAGSCMIEEVLVSRWAWLLRHWLGLYQCTQGSPTPSAYDMLKNTGNSVTLLCLIESESCVFCWKCVRCCVVLKRQGVFDTLARQRRIQTAVAWVRERTIPTERPPLVGEVSANFCGWRGLQ
jgi:hypothetical protein